MDTKFRSSYDTETVRKMLGLESAQDVRNLTRPGKALYKALLRGGPRGRFDITRVKRLRVQMIRRRLAEKLGRISPRFLDDSHSLTCPECKALAVEWNGKILCEDGHQLSNPEDESIQLDTQRVSN